MKPRARLLVEMALVFVACAVAFHAMLAQAPGLLDIDALYHFKVARLILHEGPWVDISWLPFTVLGDHGPDHQWLFHVLLAPLTLLGNDLDAVTWASAIVAAAMPAALLPFLHRAAVPWPALFAVAMLCTAAILPGRFLSLRAQDLAVVLMVATLFFAAWRRPVALGIVAFLFMQSYHAAVVTGLLVVAVVGAHWLLTRRVETRLVTAAIVGTAAGLAASPWFPANVRYLLFHTFFKTTQAKVGLVGNEWLPVTWAHLALESWPAHLLLASGLAALSLAIRRDPRRWRIAGADTMAAGVATLAFLAMYRFGWRFVEYYAPFAVLTAALLWRDAIGTLGTAHARIRSRRAIAACLACIVAVGMWVGGARVGSALTHRFDAYADMMRYVDAHDPRPMIVDTLWSDFQQMFYWSERGRFVAGLDGHYLLYGDLDRFKAWNALATGEAAQHEGNAAMIRDAFGARWAVLPRGHDRLAAALAKDPDARLVMATPDGWLFEIRQALPRPE